MKNSFSKSGIVLVNKPAGISSNAVVNKVKRAIGAKKCGHLGTLDLEGSGLLPVTVNGATKLFDFFLNKDKTYETVFVFGVETDTLDMSGKVVRQKECDIQTEQVETAIKTMICAYDQLPPQFSAKKVDGKTAYNQARLGIKVELKPKRVEIFDFKLLEKLEKNTFKFEISCSSGTYIRSVCRDLAEKLSTYGTMKSILRTRCGMFNLCDSSTIEQVENGDFSLISCESVFDYGRLDVEKSQLEKLLNGVDIQTNCDEKFVKIFCENEFFGVGKILNNKLRFHLRLF